MSESVEQAALRRASGELNLFGDVLEALQSQTALNEAVLRALTATTTRIEQLEAQVASLSLIAMRQVGDAA